MGLYQHQLDVLGYTIGQVADAYRALGKSMSGVIPSAAPHLKGRAVDYVVFDDHLPYLPGWLKTHIPIKSRDKDGRDQKPPIADTTKAPKPGMIRVRDRTGQLVWRDPPAIKAKHPLWGIM